MNKKDISELKRRFKKTSCTLTRLAGCYVNVDKEMQLRFNENFLNLEEEEFHKYLELASKTLSGTLGNNLLELEFPKEEEAPGGRQQFLMGLKESKLKNEELLTSFFQHIIDHYEYAGNYLILVYHDAYDVMTRTSDNDDLDESEEVYEYILCSICPVTLSKAALGYLEVENRIGPRVRDWVVGVPDAGFVFPAFTDRSTDIHTVMYYTKDAKEPHPEVMEDILGCPSRLTATEQKTTFTNIVNNAVADENKREKVFFDIQETLNEIVEEQAIMEERGQEIEPILLTPTIIHEVLSNSGVAEEIAAKIESSYTDKFEEMPPVVDHLIDNKALTTGMQKKKEQELMVEVQVLKDQLTAAREAAGEAAATGECPVVLTVTPERADRITAQTIDGKRYLLIPIEENEMTRVNGVEELF